jgi:hypothetical protein
MNGVGVSPPLPLIFAKVFHSDTLALDRAGKVLIQVHWFCKVFILLWLHHQLHTKRRLPGLMFVKSGLVLHPIPKEYPV